MPHARVEPLLHPARQLRVAEQQVRGLLDVVHVDPAVLALDLGEAARSAAASAAPCAAGAARPRAAPARRQYCSARSCAARTSSRPASFSLNLRGSPFCVSSASSTPAARPSVNGLFELDALREKVGCARAAQRARRGAAALRACQGRCSSTSLGLIARRRTPGTCSPIGVTGCVDRAVRVGQRELDAPRRARRPAPWRSASGRASRPARR